MSALYVFDPGPDGSIGDTSWIVDARARGALPLLIVQGVLLTDLARAADFVLPGASYVEKEASYTNDQGRLQGAGARDSAAGRRDGGLADSGEPRRGRARRAARLHERRARARRHRGPVRRRPAGIRGLSRALTFGRPVAARHWLQASNPSERWKWDFMFQDLPPVKGTVDPSSLPLPPGAIPLKGSESEKLDRSQVPADRVSSSVRFRSAAARRSWRRRRAGADRRPKANVTPIVERDGVRAGTPVRVALQVSLPEGFHVQSNKPRDPLLIPTGADDRRAGRRHRRRDRVSAVDRSEAGRPGSAARGVRARVRDRRAPDARARRAGTLDVPARLRYQACDDNVLSRRRRRLRNGR